MNVRYVISRVGLLFIVLSILMLFMSATVFFLPRALLQHDVDPEARLALLLSAGVGAMLGGLLWLLTRSAPRQLGRSEAMLLVALSWLLGAGLGALPFYLWGILDEVHEIGHPFADFASCYFEAMSGLSTTGATVLSDIEAVPDSLVFWRATTHWVGGLGIVVLFVAVLPSLGVGGKKMFQLETPSAKARGVQPRVTEAARVIGLIYIGLTLAQFVALWAIARMDWFSALCHAFTSMATGGFSNRDASAAAFDSVAVDVIIIIFMLLAGVNFGLYLSLLRGRADALWKDTELRVYLGIIIIATLVIVGSTAGHSIVTSAGRQLDPSMGASIRHGLFQVTSLQTGTGLVTADYDRWGFLPKSVLLTVMFIGGCAGSTTGGLKVIRVWMTLRILLAEVERVFRPHVIRPMRIGGSTLDDSTKLATVGYVLGVILLSMVGAVALMLVESDKQIDFTTAASASIATLNIVGPGLGRVGAVENYGWFSDAGKYLMSIMMALGRVEIFAIIVLFSPRFWRGK